MQGLPSAARRRILSGARAQLSAEADQPLPAYGVPLTAAAWTSVLRDLSPAGRADSVAQAADDLVAARDASELRTAGEEFVNRAAEFALDLRLTMAFGPARSAGVEGVRQSILALAAQLLQAVEDDSEPPSATAWNTVSAQATRVTDPLDPGATTDDPLSSAFGLAPVDGYDPGRRTTYQLIAVYRERFDKLIPSLLRILEALPHPNRGLDGAVSSTLRLLASPAPLLTLQAAVEVYDAVGVGIADSARTIGALVDLQRDVPRSATNSQHSAELAERPGGQSPGRDALRELELYKSVIEGQVRSWIWTLLRIEGVSAATQAPMLATLRDQATSELRGPALRRAAKLVEPAVRNAQAHEAAVWDADSEALLIGGKPYTEAALADMARRAYAFMLGAETGLACAASRWADLAYALDTSRLHERLRPLDEDSALLHFAMNRFVVRRWEDRRRTFTVLIDQIGVAQVGHCCQALIHAAACLPETERFILQHGRDAATVLDLPRACLEAAGPVWFWARSRFEQMPPSTFLPILTEARLATESAEQCVSAAVWMAVNDVQNDAEGRLEGNLYSPSSRRALIDRARGAGIALGATAARLITLGLPGVETEPIHATRQTLENMARSLARNRTRTISAHELGAIISKLDGIRLARPAPAALPALDPTPIDQMPRSGQPPIGRLVS